MSNSLKIISGVRNTLIVMGVTVTVLLITISCLCTYCCCKRRRVKPKSIPIFPEPIDEFASIPENGWAFESTATQTTPGFDNNTEFFPLNLTVCEPIGAAPRIIPAPPIYYPQESMTEDPFYSLKRISPHPTPMCKSNSMRKVTQV